MQNFTEVRVDRWTSRVGVHLSNGVIRWVNRLQYARGALQCPTPQCRAVCPRGGNHEWVHLRKAGVA